MILLPIPHYHFKDLKMLSAQRFTLSGTCFEGSTGFERDYTDKF